MALMIPTFVMGAQNVEHVSTFKYLRVMFSEKDDWDTLTNHVLQRFELSIRCMAPIIHM
jgi:hypothetical protein